MPSKCWSLRTLVRLMTRFIVRKSLADDALTSTRNTPTLTWYSGEGDESSRWPPRVHVDSIQAQAGVCCAAWRKDSDFQTATGQRRAIGDESERPPPDTTRSEVNHRPQHRTHLPFRGRSRPAIPYRPIKATAYSMTCFRARVYLGETLPCPRPLACAECSCRRCHFCK